MAEPMSDKRLTEAEWLADLRLRLSDCEHTLAAETERADDAEAEVRRLRAQVARVEALHLPMDDGPASMVASPYCSCGARVTRIMSDGYPSVVPASWDECPTRAALAQPTEADQ